MKRYAITILLIMCCSLVYGLSVYVIQPKPVEELGLVSKMWVAGDFNWIFTIVDPNGNHEDNGLRITVEPNDVFGIVHTERIDDANDYIMECQVVGKVPDGMTKLHFSAENMMRVSRWHYEVYSDDTGPRPAGVRQGGQ